MADLGCDEKKLTKLYKRLNWGLGNSFSKLGLKKYYENYINANELMGKAEFKDFDIEKIKRIADKYANIEVSEIDGEFYIRKTDCMVEEKKESNFVVVSDASAFPSVVYCTKNALWKIFKYRGIYKLDKEFISFSIGLSEKDSKEHAVFIYIDMQMAMKDGILFYTSHDSIITNGKNGFLSPKYFKKVILNNNEVRYDLKKINFDYILVLDFEANCVDEGQLECQEIIEFPVKALNTQTLDIDFVFHTYVKPEVVPEITPFCTQLTGITQEMVEGQGNLLAAFDKFHEFLVSTNLINARWVFLTFGDWDFKVFLTKEAKYKNITIPSYYNAWINVRNIVPKFKGGMRAMMQLFGIEWIGKQHSGIDDVTNLCECVKYLYRSDIEFTEYDITYNSKDRNNLPMKNKNILDFHEKIS